MRLCPVLSNRRPRGSRSEYRDAIERSNRAPPRRALHERLLNVQHWVETGIGGRFLERQEPELVARDMQTFFAGLER